jgi:cardiolipin synthase
LEYLVIPSTWLASRSFVAAIVHVPIAAAVTVHTLINKRDVPAAIGWIGMAWLAPVVGALLYLGFGINRVKRRARRLKGSLRNVAPLRASGAAPSDPIERLKIAIAKITGQDISTGKVAAALACGDEAYPRMLAAIEGAKVSVALST